MKIYNFSKYSMMHVVLVILVIDTSKRGDNRRMGKSVKNFFRVRTADLGRQWYCN